MARQDEILLVARLVGEGRLDVNLVNRRKAEGPGDAEVSTDWSTWAIQASGLSPGEAERLQAEIARALEEPSKGQVITPAMMYDPRVQQAMALLSNGVSWELPTHAAPSENRSQAEIDEQVTLAGQAEVSSPELPETIRIESADLEQNWPCESILSTQVLSNLAETMQVPSAQIGNGQTQLQLPETQLPNHGWIPTQSEQRTKSEQDVSTLPTLVENQGRRAETIASVEFGISTQVGGEGEAGIEANFQEDPRIVDEVPTRLDPNPNPGSGTLPTLAIPSDDEAGDDRGEPAVTLASQFADPVPARFTEVSPLGSHGPRDPSSRYSRTRLHAQGGLGRVWMARDEVIGRNVALKELRANRVEDNQSCRRFLSEARITGQLDHPNIVTVHELGQHKDNGNLYYTMRFVQGRTLSEAIAAYHADSQRGLTGSISLRDLIGNLIALAQAVAYAHSRGVIHRDLKGQNVAIGDYGEVVLLDWGLAKPIDGRDQAEPVSPQGIQADSQLGLTRTGQILGTPGYMSPEQARGEIERIGPASDIFSLGAILFEILIGQPPYTGITALEIVHLTAKASPPRPREVDSGLPADLDAICAKAMASRPEDRYATAIELAEDLKRWLADEPITAAPERWTDSLRRWAKRNRVVVLVSTAVILTIIPILLITSFQIAEQRDRALKLESIARMTVDDLYVNVAEAYLTDLSDTRQEAFLERAIARFQGDLLLTGGPADSADSAIEGQSGSNGPRYSAAVLPTGQTNLVEKALAYYASFTDQDGIPQGSDLELGRAWTRIGQLHARLGRFGEASNAFDQAIQRLVSLTEGDGTLEAVREARRRLLETYLARGELNLRMGIDDQAREDLDRAIAMAEPLSRTSGGVSDPQVVVDLAAALRHRGELAKYRGQTRQAETDLSTAIRRLQSLPTQAADREQIEHDLAITRDALAWLLLLQDRTEEAERLLDQATGALARLVERSPTKTRFREALAKAENTLGLLYRQQHRYPESEARLESARVHLVRLTGDFPARIDYRRGLTRALANLGLVRLERGRPREAIPSFTQVLQDLDRLIEELPRLFKAQRDAAIVQSNLALSLVEMGRHQDAQRELDRAVERAKTLLEAFPDRPEAALALSRSLWRRGQLHQIQGDNPSAMVDLTGALRRIEELLEQAPDRIAYRSIQAEILLDLGLTLAAEQKGQQATDRLEQALSINESLLNKPQIDRIVVQERMARTLVNWHGSQLDVMIDKIRRALDLYQEIAQSPQGDSEIAEAIAIGHYNLGENLLLDGQTDLGLAEYKMAVDQLGVLAEAESATSLNDFYLSLARLSLAQALIGPGQSDPSEVVDLLEASVAAGTAAVRANPANPSFVSTWREASELLVTKLIASGQIDRAGEVALELPAVLPERPDLRLDAARLLALCLQAQLGPNPSEPSSAPERFTSPLARKAIAQLQVAIDTGVEAESLRQVREQLEPLIDFPQIQAIFEELSE